MAATAEQIARLRRMTSEPTTTTYSDIALGGIIERYPLTDAAGEPPSELDTSTSPPTVEANEDWIATYDLHAAAAEVWEEKAAALAAKFDFRADGGSFSRSQGYEMASKLARWHRARRSPGVIELVAGD